MTRFILIVTTFGFLAVAFYEMSGGADFDAEATRMARVEQPPVVEQDKIDNVVAGNVAPALPPVDENVTRVTLNLTSVNDVLRPKSNLKTERVVQTSAVIAEEDVAVSEEEPTIILPSLLVDRPVITPVDFNASADEVASTGAEVRRVTGNRVNMRGGPGTDYSVVGRLVRGDDVEILQDPGNGWVKLRPVAGGTVGWMADFLLSEG